MLSRPVLAAQLDNCLEDAQFAQWSDCYSRGKVRDMYKLEGKRILITTDRQSAFDHVLGAIPFKGQALNALSNWWFEQTKDVVPKHLLEVPDPNCAVVREVEMLPVEIVVRAYITGTTDTSAWMNYAEGAREFCGVRLPEGLRKNQRFDTPIITPTTKAEGHDEKISAAQIVERGLVPETVWQEVAAKALALFARGAELAAKNGLILVDTKYEMGLSEEGQLLVADEVHTPDSSRFWTAATYEERFAAGQEPENLDKEFLRLWLKEKGISDDYLPPLDDDIRIETATRYLGLYEQVTGEAFVPGDTEMPVRDRIEGNLAKYF